MMPPALRWSMTAIDVAMLAYWGTAALAVVGVLTLPAAAMYGGYGTPVIDAWNWSFVPLDILLALTGLASVRLARRGDPRWHGWAIVSLTLTGCAGLLAVSFWALRSAFDAAWWLPNLVLLAMPLVWLPRLIVR